MTEVRLQKVLAAAGLGSRRKCEEFIVAGRVEVDGEVVDELGSRVDPAVSEIRVDGVLIAQAQGHIVVALNKPVGVVTTMSDPQGRPCVGDLVADFEQRLFHVGRLDSETSGLLLLTNDGELAQRLGHPSYEVFKTYVAKVAGRFTADDLRVLLAGVKVDDQIVDVAEASILDSGKETTAVRLTIHEGRNRIVRRLFDELGYPVRELVRTKIGPVSLGQQPIGQLRELTNAELGKLYTLVGL
jgi:23S rRNA pseudouridine2605 synthase